MPERRSSATSYAILGLLAIKPWSTYELTKQMRRALAHVWPRAESNLYKEPPRLVQAGLATAQHTVVGRRPRTVYSITPQGRADLIAWLGRPAAPTVLESEALLKVLFGNMSQPEVLMGHLRAFADEAEATDEPWREIAREYIGGIGPFPERLHVNALFWVLLDRWARLRADWARWALAEVETWPDSDGPRDRTKIIETLRKALDDDRAFPPRPGSDTTTPDIGSKGS
ncbi:MAG: helix-turn-helix transcriptional regulator [Chloroflexota bacterium]